MKRNTTLFSGLVLVCFSASAFAQQDPEDSFKSHGGNERIEVTWKNNLDRSIYIKWIDFEGNTPRLGHEIKAGEEFNGITYAGHGFNVATPEQYKVVIPSGQASRVIDVRLPAPENSTRDNMFEYENDFQRGNYRTRYFGRYAMWTHSWTFKSNGQKGVNFLTEITRTANSIELQDPKNGTKIVLKKVDERRGIAEVTRTGRATVFTDGHLYKHVDF